MIDPNMKDLIAVLAICLLIGSCAHSASQISQLDACLKANKEYIDGNCVTPGSGPR